MRQCLRSPAKIKIPMSKQVLKFACITSWGYLSTQSLAAQYPGNVPTALCVRLGIFVPQSLNVESVNHAYLDVTIESCGLEPRRVAPAAGPVPDTVSSEAEASWS